METQCCSNQELAALQNRLLRSQEQKMLKWKSLECNKDGKDSPEEAEEWLCTVTPLASNSNNTVP